MKKKTESHNLIGGSKTLKGKDWRVESLKGKCNAIENDGEINFEIIEPGKESWALKFCTDVSLLEGKDYIFEMKARSESPRTLNVNIKKNCEKYLPYANGRMIDLSTDWQDYSWKFTMKEPDDAVALLSFDMGGNAVSWSLKDVSLKLSRQEAFDRDFRDRIQKNSGYFNAPNEPWELRFYSLEGKLLKVLDKGRGGEGMRAYPREDRSGVIVVKEAAGD
jgi:mannan endo-1,4-beta-mannosidase